MTLGDTLTAEFSTMASAPESGAYPDAEKNAYDPGSSAGHVEQLTNVATYYNTKDANDLSEDHKAYLLQRHGTLELDPLPGYGDADPYNWTTSKVSLLRLSSYYSAKSSRKLSTLCWSPFMP